MSLHYPIGNDDFRAVREAGLVYVDKSRLIRDMLEMPGFQTLLICRPRRFGKTLNLSMLRYFFERSSEDRSSLFAGLEIVRSGASYLRHFQRHPVIFFTLKGIKETSWEACNTALRREISLLFETHREALGRPGLTPTLQREAVAILEGRADDVTLRRSLKTLSQLLHEAWGEQALILIDEHDEPIRAGYLHGFLPDVLQFFRTFLGEALKGNPHLFRAVLTGITRTAKENIFSDLNNLGVFTLLAPELRDCFGFTEAEVQSLLEQAGIPGALDDVRDYYNGYVFGGPAGLPIYNPWSILNFLASASGLLQNWWLSSSSNDLVQELLRHYALRVRDDFRTLLEGGYIERRLAGDVVFDQLKEDPDALWNLLVFAGYLKAEAGEARRPREVPPYRLSIPNREVREVYTQTFQRWLRDRVTSGGGDLPILTRALLEGDAMGLQEQLQAFVGDVLSYHDLGRAPAPEQVYHAFLAGLLAVLEPGYRVRSNRESGSGRPDVLIIPESPGRPGVVLELKVAGRRGQSLRAALRDAVGQLQALDYAAELRAAGASPIHLLAIAFDGKRVMVERVDPP